MTRGVHAKITGGGGNGGCLLATYVPCEDFDMAGLKEALETAGFELLEASIEEEGLIYH